MAEENDSSLELKGPAGTGFSARGKKTSELIAFLSFSIMVLLIYVLWEHKNDDKEFKITLANVLTEHTKAGREAAAATREMTCILRTPQNERGSERIWENCRAIARIQP